MKNDNLFQTKPQFRLAGVFCILAFGFSCLFVNTKTYAQKAQAQLTPSKTATTTAPATAEEIMTAAKAKAAATQKNVMIIFHASWCGWCKKMDASIEDASCKAYFDKNYVIEHLTVMENGANVALENPGAEKMLEQYGGGESGIPYWLIFSADGKLLADSKFHTEDPADKANGQNMGCPAQPAEVDYFLSVLKKTSKMTDTEAAAVKTRFLKNAPHK